jgi:hypothetical protein
MNVSDMRNNESVIIEYSMLCRVIVYRVLYLSQYKQNNAWHPWSGLLAAADLQPYPSISHRLWNKLANR